MTIDAALCLPSFSNPLVKTFATGRLQRFEQGPSQMASSLVNGFNLATHVGDDRDRVLKHRHALSERLGVSLAWLQQVHGVEVAKRVESELEVEPIADAQTTVHRRLGLAILTADCLPAIFSAVRAPVIGAAHAGWRGLLNGVLEETVLAMRSQLRTSEVIEAGFGAAIGPKAFEVGPEVRSAFLQQDSTIEVQRAFLRNPQNPDRWFADLYQLAKIRLEKIGVVVLPHQIPNASADRIFAPCTFTQSDRFFSHRRDGPKPNGLKDQKQTGRQATIIWMTPD